MLLQVGFRTFDGNGDYRDQREVIDMDGGGDNRDISVLLWLVVRLIFKSKRIEF